MKKEILQIFNPSPAEPAQPLPARVEPPPFVSPNYLMIGALLGYAKLPDTAAAKKLESLGAEFEKVLESMKGFSNDDVKTEWLKLRQQALDGKLAADEVPSREELNRRHSLTRQTIKLRAANVSRKGCLIAADVLEDALKKHLPGFVAQIIASEEAVSPVVGKIEASPLRRVLAEFPKFVQVLIDKYRADTGGMRNPRNLLTFS